MMKKFKGIVKFRDIGVGCWEFVTKEGQKFELIGGDDSLYKDGKKTVHEEKRDQDLLPYPLNAVASQKAAPSRKMLLGFFFHMITGFHH